MLVVYLIAMLVNPSLSSVDCSSKSSYTETQSLYKFTLISLPYPDDFLSPFISEDILVAHHEHHQQAYVDELNHFMETNDGWNTFTLVELNENAQYDVGLEKYAGGVYNHDLFWYVLTNPECAKDGPEGMLADKILEQWSSIDNFLSEFNNTLKSVFGSGWVWACVNDYYEIEIRKTSDEKNPLMPIDLQVCMPFLCADVWEHSHYLDYEWDRQRYFNAFFESIDWDTVEYFYENYARHYEEVEF